jgi:hypothetical protein
MTFGSHSCASHRGLPATHRPSVASAIRYQRGFDHIVVTTRLTGTGPSRWSDPEVAFGAHEPERIEFGGHEGWLVIDPVGTTSVPHIWGIAGPLVITIAGSNVGGEDLVRIAESLRARG